MEILKFGVEDLHGNEVCNVTLQQDTSEQDYFQFI